MKVVRDLHVKRERSTSRIVVAVFPSNYRSRNITLLRRGRKEKEGDGGKIDGEG